jgi:hypothetical protein
MNRTHSGLTIAIPVKEGGSCALRKELRALRQTHGKGSHCFDRSPTVLFVSGVIIGSQKYNKTVDLPETFVFATTYWGPASVHLDDLISTQWDCLIGIFQHCKGFQTPASPQSLKKLLKDHAYGSAFGSRYQRMTKDEITREKKLRDEIHRYLSRAQDLDAFDSLSAVQIKTLIQRHIRIREEKFGWAFRPAKSMSLPEFWIQYRTIVFAVAALGLLNWALWKASKGWVSFMGNVVKLEIIIAVELVIAILVWMWLIARQRNETAKRPDDDHVRSIAASQLNPVLNEMTAAVPLKPGWLRQWYYYAALGILRVVTKQYTVPTVSSIRWLVIDDRKRLVFLSNFSNMTDFYVRDFLNAKLTAYGINFMFTNGTYFPDAKLLYRLGILGNPEGYMNAVHTGQHVTDLWYAHEPMLTQDLIHQFREIRNGLFREMDEEDAAKWLRLL